MSRITPLATALAGLVVLTASMASAEPTYPPHQGRPVIDAANVIPATEEAALNARLLNYERTSGHQLAVATVPSLEEYTIDEYANGYFRFLRLGHRTANDGTLLLFAPVEKKMRIEVGYGLEGVLTDADAMMIIENDMKPHLSSTRPDLFHVAIAAGADAIMAKTSMDMESIRELQIKKETEARRNAAAFWAFAANLFAGAGILGAAWGGLEMFVFGPKRRKQRREREKLLLAERILREKQRTERYEAERAASQKRRDEARELEAKRRLEAEERRAAETQARERMLAAMTPAALAAFLAKEEADRVAARERKRQAEIAERERAAKRRKDDDERRDRERREESTRSAYSPPPYSPPPYSPPPPPPSSSWDGGGGSSGGAGASGGFD